MRRIRASRPSPALIVAALALIAALAGTAIAGPGANTSALTKKKVKKLVKKEVAEQIADQQGPAGEQGPAGPRGPQGSPAASMLAGSVPSIETHEGIGDNFGIQPIGAASASAPNGMLSPNATVVLRDLSVALSSAPGAGSSRRVELALNSVTTLIGCTISDTETSCNTGSQTATLPPGTQFELRMKNQDPDTAPADTVIRFGYRAVSP